jgi:preprotein translocase subunit SecF
MKTVMTALAEGALVANLLLALAGVLLVLVNLYEWKFASAGFVAFFAGFWAMNVFAIGESPVAILRVLRASVVNLSFFDRSKR